MASPCTTAAGVASHSLGPLPAQKAVSHYPRPRPGPAPRPRTAGGAGGGRQGLGRVRSSFRRAPEGRGFPPPGPLVSPTRLLSCARRRPGLRRPAALRPRAVPGAGGRGKLGARRKPNCGRERREGWEARRKGGEKED